jgi:hypothetical protein
MLASIIYPRPRNCLIVRAFAGDSTMTREALCEVEVFLAMVLAAIRDQVGNLRDLGRFRQSVSAI